MGKLRDYRAKRAFTKTSEPSGSAPAGRPSPSSPPRFVVQEHHATRLHWDFRLERDGVLVSWAVPKGIPPDPKRNHLAVHVEDHPLDYIGFEGQIPKGNYGGGAVMVWDQGTYEVHKWEMDARRPEVMVTLHGRRLEGRYVLFQTRGKDWMIHRMDPPQDAQRVSMPDRLEPMTARLGDGLPSPDRSWAFEFKWDGIRAVVFSEGGSIRIVTRNQEDVTRRYPELRAISEALGSYAAVLDGEIVALGPGGTPSFEQLQQRMGLTSETEIRRQRSQVPVVYMAFDVVYLDGRDLRSRPYLERREHLLRLALAGPHWQTPEHRVGDGAAMLEGSSRAGLEGIMAKRVDSLYESGRRSGAWLKIKNHLRQELVIGGWLDGEGRRRGQPGALLVGYWEGDEFVYAGKVGTGFTNDMLDRLAAMLAPLTRAGSPFDRGRPSRAAHFTEPSLVAEFQFAEWTRAGHLRAPSFKGLRADKPARDVVRERAQP